MQVKQSSQRTPRFSFYTRGQACAQLSSHKHTSMRDDAKTPLPATSYRILLLMFWYLFISRRSAIFFYSLIIGEDFLFGIKLSSASVRLDIAVRQTSHSIVMASAVVETQLEARRIRRRVTVWIHAAAFTCDRIFFCYYPASSLSFTPRVRGRERSYLG